MAPRLSRWIALTVVAAGIVATTLLTTGGTPLLFLGWGYLRPDEGEISPALRQIAGAREALGRVRNELSWLEQQEQLDAVTARTSADPLALRREGGKLVVDHPATAALDSLWRTLPARRGEIRTIVLQQGRLDATQWWGNQAADLLPDGTCFIRTSIIRSPSDLVNDIRTDGGDCLFAERFGPPGKGVGRWSTDVRPGLSWDRTMRTYWYREAADQEERMPASWFQQGSGGDFWRSEYGWTAVNRAEMACVLGRAEECENAAGVGQAGWPARQGRRAFYYHRFPNARMPRDLMHAVGPEKFAEIWSSDLSIAASYAQVTGAPMGGWLMKWGRRFTGTVIRDNALSLVGWLGALVWMTLLSVLTAQRLKQRAVT